MNRLEQYIRENAAAFDTDSPSGEAEERFLEKWEAGRRRVRIFRTLRRCVQGWLTTLTGLPAR